MRYIKFSSKYSQYFLPISFSLIISIMLLTSLFAVSLMYKNSDKMMETMNQGSISLELLNNMSEAAFSRSNILLEMINNDDPFENDELFLELNQLATKFSLSRARFESFEHEENLQALLDKQSMLTKVNAPIQLMVYEYLQNDERDQAIILFNNVAFPKQKEILDLFQEMSEYKFNLTQNTYQTLKKESYKVLSTVIILDLIGILVSIILTTFVIKKQRISESKLARLATTDTLTKLPNRDSFIHNVDQIINNNPSSTFAVIFFDIDYFKSINDNYGHETGNEILKCFSSKIKSYIQEEDLLSRFGGDEFVLLLRSTHSEREAKTFIRELSSNLETSFNIKNNEIFITACIGVSFYSLACKSNLKYYGEDAASLLRHADIAMYYAKESGRNCFRFFSEETSKKMEREHFVRQSLHSILKNQNLNKELSIVYQPLINISNGDFTECEALIRWSNSEGATISPDEFIPIAEKTNLIEKINLFVIDVVCMQQSEWQKKGGTDIRININLSGNKFIFKRLLCHLEKNIEKLNLNPNLFGVELTERTLFEISEETINTLDNIRKKGMKISIDDFGTGYSSLTYLKKLPITTLKIDKEFITGLPDDLDDFVLVRTIINLGHSLGLDIVAEGVETIEQLNFLKANSCNIVQGYYLHKPLKSTQILQLKSVA